MNGSRLPDTHPLNRRREAAATNGQEVGAASPAPAQPSQKFEMYGTVVFMWGQVKPPYCVCCGESDVPHAHNYNRHIRFDRREELLEGGMIGFESKALNSIPGIEGRRVRVSIEVVEEEE